MQSYELILTLVLKKREYDYRIFQSWIRVDGICRTGSLWNSGKVEKREKLINGNHKDERVNKLARLVFNLISNVECFQNPY